MPELAVVVCRIMVAKDTREDSARALALIARHLIRIKPGDFAQLLIVQSKLLITMVRTHHHVWISTSFLSDRFGLMIVVLLSGLTYELASDWFPV